MYKWHYCLIYLLYSAVIICLWQEDILAQDKAKGGEPMDIGITSPAFEQGSMIPEKYTCKGKDISPPLIWGGVPEGTKSICLICDDPDAPMGTWVHWVIYSIPPNTTGLPEGIPPKGILENGSTQGRNDFRKIGYGGPCPPAGTHRYYFRIYAIDTKIDLEPGATKKELLKIIEGHILAQGQLMGKYKK